MSQDKLNQNIVHLISALLDRLPQPTRQLLEAQVSQALVVDEVPGRVINLVIPDNLAKVPLPDGPVYPIPTVIGANRQLLGELILWVRDGFIVGLERPWFTDDPPDIWPDFEQLEFGED